MVPDKGVLGVDVVSYQDLKSVKTAFQKLLKDTRVDLFLQTLCSRDMGSHMLAGRLQTRPKYPPTPGHCPPVPRHAHCPAPQGGPFLHPHTPGLFPPCGFQLHCPSGEADGRRAHGLNHPLSPGALACLLRRPSQHLQSSPGGFLWLCLVHPLRAVRSRRMGLCLALLLGAWHAAGTCKSLMECK